MLKDADPEFLLAAIRIVHAGSAVIAAVLVGLVLGSFYFWAGARSLLASISGSPGLVLPAIPLGLLAIVASGAALLTLVAFVVPSRRATRIAPVATLAVESPILVGHHSHRPANCSSSLKALTGRPSEQFFGSFTCP